MPQPQMKRATLRIGIFLLVLFAGMTCAGVAMAETTDTGDTGTEYTTYYRGSGCIKAGSCTAGATALEVSTPALAVLLVGLGALARRRR